MATTTEPARGGPESGPRSHARVVVPRFGGPEVLEVIEEAPPEPKRGEVRLRMLAAGVALPDLLMREGVHPEARRPPFTPGWDLGGVVDRVGEGVAGVEPGTTMAGLPVRGAQAAYVCLRARDPVPVPLELDPAEAVALVPNYVTALQMLYRVARVRPGDRVLVHGAAGAVGTALLQLARRAGTVASGTCNARGAETVRALGAVDWTARWSWWATTQRPTSSSRGSGVGPRAGGREAMARRSARRPRRGRSSRRGRRSCPRRGGGSSGPTRPTSTTSSSGRTCRAGSAS